MRSRLRLCSIRFPSWMTTSGRPSRTFRARWERKLRHDVATYRTVIVETAMKAPVTE